MLPETKYPLFLLTTGEFYDFDFFRLNFNGFFFMKRSPVTYKIQPVKNQMSIQYHLQFCLMIGLGLTFDVRFILKNLEKWVNFKNFTYFSFWLWPSTPWPPSTTIHEWERALSVSTYRELYINIATAMIIGKRTYVEESLSGSASLHRRHLSFAFDW